MNSENSTQQDFLNFIGYKAVKTLGDQEQLYNANSFSNEENSPQRIMRPKTAFPIRAKTADTQKTNINRRQKTSLSMNTDIVSKKNIVDYRDRKDVNYKNYIDGTTISSLLTFNTYSSNQGQKKSKQFPVLFLVKIGKSIEQIYCLRNFSQTRATTQQSEATIRRMYLYKPVSQNKCDGIQVKGKLRVNKQRPGPKIFDLKTVVNNLMNQKTTYNKPSNQKIILDDNQREVQKLKIIESVYRQLCLKGKSVYGVVFSVFTEHFSFLQSLHQRTLKRVMYAFGIDSDNPAELIQLPKFINFQKTIITHEKSFNFKFQIVEKFFLANQEYILGVECLAVLDDVGLLNPFKQRKYIDLRHIVSQLKKIFVVAQVITKDTDPINIPKLRKLFSEQILSLQDFLTLITGNLT